MDALSSALPYLQKLFLAATMEKVPHWFSSLNNLTHLTLQRSGLGEDLLSQIQALPNLSFLRLEEGAYNQEHLCFAQGFLKLRRLEIFWCPLLAQIVIEEDKDAMPGLQRITVADCKRLRGLVPCDLDRLPNLKFLLLRDVSDDLKERVCKEMLNMTDPPTMRGITLTRPNDADDESESKWFYKILS